MALLPPPGELLSIGEEHDYTVTITVHGTDLDDCADLVVLFAEKIRERVGREEGSIGMAEGEYTVEELPEEEETYIQVEFDLNYWGGDYSSMNSENAYVPYRLVQECGSVEAAFEQHTGHDHAHIIHYSEGEYLTRQEFLETYGVELDEKEVAGDENDRNE